MIFDLDLFNSIFSSHRIAAVRYGRVPKRSREISGNEDPNVRVQTPSTPSTPITPTTPQMCSVASPPDIAPLAPDPSELPGSTELTVYDVILCVSQAHRTHCTYTDELTRGLLRKPVTLPTDPVKVEDDCEVSVTCDRNGRIFVLILTIYSRLPPNLIAACVINHRHNKS